MRKILVTGATGFIGHEVSKQLSRQGYRPRLMVRRPIRGMLVQSLNAELRQGDLSRPDSLKRMVDGIDTVIHLGAMATFEAYEKVRDSIVEGSLNLMRAAIEQGAENFIYGGSMLAYESQSGPITQKTAASPRSGYGRAKLEAETRLRETADEAGIRFISLRLPHVYGAKSLLFYQVRKGRIIFSGRGDNLFAHLHVCDAARALIKAAQIGKTGVFVIADNLSCSWNEFFETTQMFYPKLRIVHIPKVFALAATAVIELFLKFRKAPNRFSRDAVDSWNLRLPVVTDTLTDILDLAPEYPSVVDGIPAVLDDCLCYTWCPSNLDAGR
jgi:nucleoside-diphosphate-sugar epimerase